MLDHHHRHDHFHHNDPQTEARLQGVESKFALIIERLTTMAIDTSKLLAEVARERTDVASLRALADAQNATMTDLAAQLKAAIAANDPTAIAQVQADLDKAAIDLATDNDATEAALAKNVTPAPGA